jgi:hypothetical protein
MSVCQRRTWRWSGRKGFTALNFISLLSSFIAFSPTYTSRSLLAYSSPLSFQTRKIQNKFLLQMKFETDEENESQSGTSSSRRSRKKSCKPCFPIAEVNLKGSTVHPNLSGRRPEVEPRKCLRLSRMVKGTSLARLRGSQRELSSNLSSLPGRFHSQFDPEAQLWTSLPHLSLPRHLSCSSQSQECETNISFLTRSEWQVCAYLRPAPGARNDLEDGREAEMKNHLDSF